MIGAHSSASWCREDVFVGGSCRSYGLCSGINWKSGCILVFVSDGRAGLGHNPRIYFCSKQLSAT